MSKYTQLCGLISELLDLLKIKYTDTSRKQEDVNIILSNINKNDLQKLRILVLQEGLIEDSECPENKFFRYIIDKFKDNDEICCKLVEVLSSNLLPHLGQVCPIPDELLHNPYDYLKSLDNSVKCKIGLTLDLLNYVLRN